MCALGRLLTITQIYWMRPVHADNTGQEPIQKRNNDGAWSEDGQGWMGAERVKKRSWWTLLMSTDLLASEWKYSGHPFCWAWTRMLTSPHTMFLLWRQCLATGGALPTGIKSSKCLKVPLSHSTPDIHHQLFISSSSWAVIIKYKYKSLASLILLGTHPQV